MFKKAVRISVDISPTDQSKQEQNSVHTISIVLESGRCLVCSWFATVHLISQLQLSTWRPMECPSVLVHKTFYIQTSKNLCLYLPLPPKLVRDVTLLKKLKYREKRATQVCIVVTLYVNKYARFYSRSVRVSGPVHRFKKLCEKLQLILLSNQRRSTSSCRADEETIEKQCADDEKRSASQNSKLRLAHLSDTESEGEVLADSPRAPKKPLASQMNGKEAVNHSWKENERKQGWLL